MRNEFVSVPYAKLHWTDRVITIPVGVILCGGVPLGALISGKNTFFGFSLTNCVLIGIGFLLLAIIERLGLICSELQTMTFLVKNLFKNQYDEDFNVSLRDLKRMRYTVRRTLGIRDDED